MGECVAQRGTAAAVTENPNTTVAPVVQRVLKAASCLGRKRALDTPELRGERMNGCSGTAGGGLDGLRTGGRASLPAGIEAQLDHAQVGSAVGGQKAWNTGHR